MKDTKNMTVVAEFDAVDYLWDDDHSKTKYELQGLYVERNNAIAGSMEQSRVAFDPLISHNYSQMI